MKFSVSINPLKEHLLLASRAIPSDPINPINKNFLLELNPGNLTIQTFGTFTNIKTELPVNTQSKGKVAAPSNILKVINLLPEQITLTFDIDESNHHILLTCKTGQYKFTGQDAFAFDNPPKPTSQANWNVESNVLINAIKNTLFAAGKDDKDDNDIRFNGALLEINEQQFSLVTTNGERLANFTYQKVKYTGKSQKLHIPFKTIQLMGYNLPKEPVDIQVEFNEGFAFFSFESTQFACRLWENRFPDYQELLNVPQVFKMTIQRAGILKGLKRLELFTNHLTHLIRFEVYPDNTLKMFAEDTERTDEAKESMTCNYEGEKFEIGLNIRYLIDVMNALESEQVEFTFSSSNEPVFIKPTTKTQGESIITLLRPSQLNSY
ncbi:MAG TPA: DNA polymerase III subunit beta [Microscillaceae bacterium]|nr:DNA polymerase III subunit beta [Microscillaceae bacterium]